MPTMVRRDALPEGTAYRDTGCRYHDSCLTCPFTQCVFEDPLRHRAETARQRAVVAMSVVSKNGGVITDAAASTAGVSIRTLYRYQHRLTAEFVMGKVEARLKQLNNTRNQATG